MYLLKPMIFNPSLRSIWEPCWAAYACSCLVVCTAVGCGGHAVRTPAPRPLAHRWLTLDSCTAKLQLEPPANQSDSVELKLSSRTNQVAA